MEQSKGLLSGLPDMPEIAPDEVLDALERVLRAVEFRQATRLRDFLAYVVHEAVAGREKLISGRTIAQDVYHRGRSDSDSDLSVVRVDAGRLRRRLVEYYSNSGANDPIQIAIPTGSYAPGFERFEPKVGVVDAEVHATGNSNFKAIAVLALAGVLGVMGYIAIEKRAQNISGRAVVSGSVAESATRLALLQKSPATLQAVNQAEQARGLMFPAPDPERLLLVLGMFEHVIELDGSYFGGYAGAAQAAGILGTLAPEGPLSTAMLAKADRYKNRALELRPESSWAQSAASWVALSKRDFETANKMSLAAMSLNPEDLYTRELGTLIALFSGEFERAVSLGAPEAFARDTTGRKTNRNAFGIAHFYLGNSQAAVEQLEEVIRRGEPVSEISIFYLVAAHQKLGNFTEARAFVRYYHNAWPEGRVDLLLKRVFISPDYVDVPLELFRSAGGFQED